MTDFRKLLIPAEELTPRTLKSVSDRLILELATQLAGPEVLVLLLHGTTLASALRHARPDLNFTFYTPEHFFWRTLNEFHGRDSAVESASTGRITLVCAADLPEQTFDEVMFPTLLGSSSELAQDLLQGAHQRLRTGGRIFVTVNNPKDHWVQAQLKSLFSNTAVQKHKQGVAFIATRSVPLKKIRGFRARFAFRHGERLIFCESRPGVFSHRRVDGGARALIRSFTLLHAESQTKEGQPKSFVPKRIIEMGSGCGAVSMAAAVDYPTARILAVDSHARAIECTEISAGLNEISNVETLLTSDGIVPEPGTWDLLLGNPPYYSDFRISELFLQTAKSSLRSGGRIHLVTKLLEWHEARMKQLFSNVIAHPIGEYTVFAAVQK
jgi:16S rRNA G1207 methylase RsmC